MQFITLLDYLLLPLFLVIIYISASSFRNSNYPEGLDAVMADREGLKVGTTMMFSAPLVEWALWFIQRTLPLIIRFWLFTCSKKSSMAVKKNNFCIVKVLMVSNEMHFYE